MLVFDVTSQASLAAVQKWLAKARAARPSLQAVLVGNKTDLVARRAVSAADAAAAASSGNIMGYFEVSAVRWLGVLCLAIMIQNLSLYDVRRKTSLAWMLFLPRWLIRSLRCLRLRRRRWRPPREV